MQANATAVKELIPEKTLTKRSFISYDSMNYYEHVRDQRLFNKSEQVNYTAGYLCFMTTPSSETEIDSWQESYLCADQIDRRLVNELKDEDFAQDMKDAGLTPIFHPWKMHLASDNAFPGQVLPPGPPVLISAEDDERNQENHEEWEVLEVVDYRKTKRYGDAI